MTAAERHVFTKRLMTSTDSTTRFSDRVDAYVAARPGYPPELAPMLRRVFGLRDGAVVADIGSGTGLSCAPFLQAGLRVIGVEPNDAMRAAGDAYLTAHRSASGRADAALAEQASENAAISARTLAGASAVSAPLFSSVKGTAEATTLGAHSVDLLIAAQAFHWFDIQAARAEALRILKRPAHVALFWNDRISRGSAFAEGYEALLLEFGTDYAEVRHRHGQDDLVAEFFAHRDFRLAVLPNPTVLDFPTLALRLNSASYVPREGTPTYAPMMARLRALFDASQRNGRVVMDYDTRVFFAPLATAV
jgi:SAM-dependent methyltransferase